MVVCDVLSILGEASVLNYTRIEARRIVVHEAGRLQIGSAERPAVGVIIYLQHAPCADGGGCEVDGSLLSMGVLHIHGLRKAAWSLLALDAPAGHSLLTVERCEGWQAGDAVVVAATGGEATDYGQAASSEDNYWAERRVLTTIQPTGRDAGAGSSGGSSGGRCVVGLDRPLRFRHRGSWLDGIVPTFAEVANLNRSVLVTGPPIYWRNEARPIEGGRGIVSAQVGPAGEMRVEWSRVERCGRIALGQYCLHLHLAGACPACAFVGNVVEGGVNKGITLHGTHHALVHNNVVHDVRGASIYIEDGNEVNNTISHNVLICPTRSNAGGDRSGRDGMGYRCKLEGVPEHVDSDLNEQAGIYTLSASNHFVGNRISGHENALYVNQ